MKVLATLFVLVPILSFARANARDVSVSCQSEHCDVSLNQGFKQEASKVSVAPLTNANCDWALGKLKCKDRFISPSYEYFNIVKLDTQNLRINVGMGKMPSENDLIHHDFNLSGTWEKIDATTRKKGECTSALLTLTIQEQRLFGEVSELEMRFAPMASGEILYMQSVTGTTLPRVYDCVKQ